MKKRSAYLKCTYLARQPQQSLRDQGCSRCDVMQCLGIRRQVNTGNLNKKEGKSEEACVRRGTCVWTEQRQAKVPTVRYSTVGTKGGQAHKGPGSSTSNNCVSVLYTLCMQRESMQVCAERLRYKENKTRGPWSWEVAACAICGSGSVRKSEEGYHGLPVVGRIKLDDREWMRSKAKRGGMYECNVM